MAINASTRRLLAQYSPQLEADTLAEIQPAVDLDPATYEGKYILALDQAAGLQLYYVEHGQVVPAYEQDGIKADDAPAKNTRYFDGADEVTEEVGVQWLTGVTAAGGSVTVFATDDATSGGAPRFASVKSVSIHAEGIAAFQENKYWVGGYTYNAGTGALVANILRGVSQSMLIGGTIVTTRNAVAGVNVLVRVEGTLAP
jgi:hypothetical protein